MVEGTGISLYILVGIIIFGLFISISAVFGEGILAQSEGIIACVESYMSDEPTDCGKTEDEDEELPEETKLRKFYHVRGGGKPMDYYLKQLSDALVADTDDFEGSLLHTYLNSDRATEMGAQFIYGVYDEEDNLIDQYEGGDRHPHDDELVVIYNDKRLIPQDVVNNGNYSSKVSLLYNPNGIMRFKGYAVTDENGMRTRHYVPETFEPR